MIKVLFTIPNFDTAGSGLPLIKLANNLNKNIFITEIACLHKNGDLFQDKVLNHFKVHVIDLYKKERPILKMILECYRLSKIFKKIKPDIIHSYNYNADYTEPLAAKMAGIKWIYTKKNMSWRGPSYRGWRLRSFLAHSIVCQNKDMIQGFFKNSNKTFLIPIGVDTNEFKKSIKNKNENVNNRYIITVANLVKIKGIHTLIKAFHQVHKNFKEWNLLIVGDYKTEYGIFCKNLVKKLEIGTRVKFLGKQKKVKKYLEKSELFVLATSKKGEGAPVSILEAMANSKNIIGSDVSGIKDQLSAFPNHLFKADDVESLVDKLKIFLGKSRLENSDFGDAFQLFVKEKFSLNREVTLIESLYKKIV